MNNEDSAALCALTGNDSAAQRAVTGRDADRFVVVSGCSGGGKSTLLAELARRGHAVVEEPGRRIVRQEQAGDGAALPWVDLAAFARRAIDMARADRAAMAGGRGWVFFDRGLVDAAAALAFATGEPAWPGDDERYHARVFLTPPWRDIYVGDPERPHDWDAAVAEYDRLATAYAALGYELCVLPRRSVADRADRILATLSGAPPARSMS